MKRSVSVLFLAAALAGAEAHAACTHPMPPGKIPDGATASKQDMINGMMAVRAFDQAIKAYTDCLKLEHDTAVSKIDPTDASKAKTEKGQLDNVWAKKNDAAVDEDSALAKQFNDQVKVYKEKNKS
ncbi:MAG TPA: hypothetical protein VGI35_06325 [Steroidobacteraceae bacterium]|jgi:hypothetical protein